MSEFYIIRHAHAVERGMWDDEDLKRPLTKEGKSNARKFFRRIFKNLPKPQIIITSEAKRSIDTGKILKKITGAELIVEKGLNPGCDNLEYLSALRSYDGEAICALIGHEPDISNFISFYTGESKLNIRMKKGSLCHIKNKVLMNLIQQDAIL